jgi:hypothetical protein
MHGPSQSPETDYNNPAVSALVEQLFAQRNASGIPPHAQRELRLAIMGYKLKNETKPVKRSPVLREITRHQPKPRGRSHQIPAIRMA